jgi:signal transduction histidine kinase
MNEVSSWRSQTRAKRLTRLSCDSFFSHYFAERAGRGLGLYIAAMRAHGGRIDVASSKEETLFTLRIPRT